MSGVELRLGAGDFNRRERSDIHLPLVVFKQPLRGFQLLLARTYVLMETHQVPIQIQDGRDRGDYLLLELQIGHFQIILLHTDVTAVDGRSESLQEILSHLKIQIA